MNRTCAVYLGISINGKRKFYLVRKLEHGYRLSGKDGDYQVLLRGGKWSCDCGDYVFRQRSTCKHCGSLKHAIKAGILKEPE